jgi:hypothetical protein
MLPILREILGGLPLSDGGVISDILYIEHCLILVTCCLCPVEVYFEGILLTSIHSMLFSTSDVDEIIC